MITDKEMLDWLNAQSKGHKWKVEIKNDYPYEGNRVFVVSSQTEGEYDDIRDAIKSAMGIDPSKEEDEDGNLCFSFCQENVPCNATVDGRCFITGEENS